MNKKIKIAHIIPSFGNGGAEKLVIDLMNNCDKEKFEVMAISLYSKQNTIYDEFIEHKNLNVVYLDKKLGLDLSMIKKINKIFKEYKPDIINTHLYSLKYTIIPAIFNKIKVRVHTIHNQAEKEVDTKSLKVHKIAFKYLNYIPVAISSKIEESTKKIYGSKNIELIRNGVDTSKFKYKRESIKDNESIELVNVARFYPAKNHRLLIEAIKILDDRNIDIKLSLVGDGPLKQSTEELVKKYNLEKKVKFLGIRNDIPEIMKKSDIFVLSSDWEGLPLSIMEAMASGLPIVATNVGGISDIVENNINGLLVESNNKDALSEAIVKLIENPDRIEHISAENYKKSEQFDIKYTQQNYEEVYCKYLNKR